MTKLTATEYRQLVSMKRLATSGQAISPELRQVLLEMLKTQSVRPGVEKLAKKLLTPGARLAPAEKRTLQLIDAAA